MLGHHLYIFVIILFVRRDIGQCLPVVAESVIVGSAEQYTPTLFIIDTRMQSPRGVEQADA
jgi:hypothetical protein